MTELKLTAVGSSPLIADEIKSVAQSFLGENIFIETALTKEIFQVREKFFYICAVTQAEKLSCVIPAEKLFVFDLHPTTKFFLDIAKIPAGAEVCVFNNRLLYTKLLADECRNLGIDKIKFRAAAYEEMPADEIKNILQAANYIVGIECLTGEQMLLSEKYRRFLNPNVKIISGKRAASVASAGKLLSGIADFYYKIFSDEKNKISDTKQAEDLAEKIFQVVIILKNAANKSVISQIDFQQDNISREKVFDIPKNSVEEQLKLLLYVKQKIQKLCKSA